jgi:hypothetical protein
VREWGNLISSRTQSTAALRKEVRLLKWPVTAVGGPSNPPGIGCRFLRPATPPLRHHQCKECPMIAMAHPSFREELTAAAHNRHDEGGRLPQGRAEGECRPLRRHSIRSASPARRQHLGQDDSGARVVCLLPLVWADRGVLRQELDVAQLGQLTCCLGPLENSDLLCSVIASAPWSAIQEMTCLSASHQRGDRGE